MSTNPGYDKDFTPEENISEDDKTDNTWGGHPRTTTGGTEEIENRPLYELLEKDLGLPNARHYKKKFELQEL